VPRYDFRLRFHFPGEDHINTEVEELIVLKDNAGATIRLRSGLRGSAIKDHSRASIIGGPYPSAADAYSAAEVTKKALLTWAVRNRVGIDLGGGRARSVITVSGLQWFEQQIGGPVRADVHGIDVYEHVDGLVFVALNFKDSLGKAAAAFVEQVAAAITSPVPISPKQELAGEILSASYFDASDRSRFVTLITAVEALVDPLPRPAAAQQVVARMVQIVKESKIDKGTRAAMSGSLQTLKKESIGQAGRALVGRLLPDKVYEGQPAARFFTFCYEVRSSILHLGHVPGSVADLPSLCSVARSFVCDLLIASFAEGG
jgi:hypothetical protein